jgi:hypothetical protein
LPFSPQFSITRVEVNCFKGLGKSGQEPVGGERKPQSHT